MSIATPTGIVTLQSACGTKSALGDSEIIAAPGAGNQIYLCGFNLQNESLVATTIQLKFGSAVKVRHLCAAQGAGIGWLFSPGREMEVGNNLALNLNLSGANVCGYTVVYYIDKVR